MAVAEWLRCMVLSLEVAGSNSGQLTFSTFFAHFLPCCECTMVWFCLNISAVYKSIVF